MQYQLLVAYSFNNEFSFFYMVANVLEQYGLPTLSNLMASDIGEEHWERAVENSV